jgi:hypothetical protein
VTATKKRKRAKLTKAEWARVFHLRCESKSGRASSFTKEDRALIDAAYNENEKRYNAMEKDVFNATVPFGSNVRWR